LWEQEVSLAKLSGLAQLNLLHGVVQAHRWIIFDVGSSMMEVWVLWAFVCICLAESFVSGVDLELFSRSGYGLGGLHTRSLRLSSEFVLVPGCGSRVSEVF